MAHLFHGLGAIKPTLVIACISLLGVTIAFAAKAMLGPDTLDEPQLAMACKKCGHTTYVDHKARWLTCGKCGTTMPVRTVQAGDERDDVVP